MGKDDSKPVVHKQPSAPQTKREHRINDSDDQGIVRFDSSIPVPKGKVSTESYSEAKENNPKSK